MNTAYKLNPVETAGHLKFTVNRSSFLRALSHVQSVVEKRTTIPVLSNVKLEVEGDSLRLTATDMEIAITDAVPVKAEADEKITVPAQMLYEIIRKLPEGSEIQFQKLAGDQVEVKSGRSKFKILSLPVDNFPVMEQGELPNKFVLSSHDLSLLIDKVRFAISHEETRYYLNGIYVHTTEENGSPVLRSAATDGHRLARVSLPMPAGAGDLPGIIIPKKTVGELKKLLAEFPGEVQIEASDAKIKFTLGDVVIISKLIDGKFPDYERVIPQANDKILEINTKALSQAVDRVSTVSFDKARAIKLAVRTGNVTVSADSSDGNTASEEIEASYSAEEIETGYNFRYMLDMMEQIEGDTVQFMLADSASPALVRDPADVSVLYVIMPMRV